VCGIVGHVVPAGERPDQAAVQRAVQQLAHRGPNDSGIVEFNTACLGHRRLSIIDLGGSPQPWSSQDERYTIIFNGEIYNYLELRQDLESSGVHFRTQGDTEVLLAMYMKYGERCLEKLNGMFAFAVWDNTARRLLIARDRVGKKPLFYAVFKTRDRIRIGTRSAARLHCHRPRARSGGDRGLFRLPIHSSASHYLPLGPETASSALSAL